jgi:hypothetical protein
LADRFYLVSSIQKQQKLNELLKDHNEKKKKPKTVKFSLDTEFKAVKVIEISDEDEANDDYSEPIGEEMISDEDFDDDESPVSNFSDDADSDFNYKIVSVNKIVRKPPSPTKKKTKLVPLARLNRSDDKPNSFYCDYCCASFRAKQGVARHVQSHIAMSVPWKCDETPCQYACSSKVKLSLHKFEAHDIAMPQQNNSEKKTRLANASPPPVITEFSCFCGASFFTMFSLRAHKK